MKSICHKVNSTSQMLSKGVTRVCMTWSLSQILPQILKSPTAQEASLSASPSLPGRSRGHAVKRRTVGGEGLANFALDHIFLEYQLHVTCVPVRVEDEFCTLGGIQVGRV